MNKLQVNLNELLIGTISIEGKDEIYKFEYTDEWKQTGYEVSPHLVLDKTIPSGIIKRFLENLLPEGKGLDDLTSFTHISKNNIFGLIQAMGFETSGALSFGSTHKDTTPLFRPITNKELTQRIDEIESKSIIIWDKKQRLSLAGVQEKLPVLLKDGELGLADGDLSSTHILKFQTKRNENIVVNEYFCMSLAKEAGLMVAEVSLRKYGDHPVFMVERFDRVMGTDTVKRLHIIDGCQMLDLPSSYKYERNFGSGRDVENIREGASFSKLFEVASLCEVPATAKLQLLDWAIYVLIIGNSDAHGKNISFFINKSGITVAPYYDMLSIIMHENVDHELAMAYGDEFDINNVLGYPLRAFSEETGLNPKLVSTRIKTVCNNVKKALDTHTIDMALFTNKEKDFTDKLHLLISKRIDALTLSAEEMLKVSY
ncbi:MAG: HipA domain-containing protein [Chloroflexota bacterium]|nr:HipA domain-containing protein [Chloroflexota bacterium]